MVTTLTYKDDNFKKLRPSIFVNQQGRQISPISQNSRKISLDNTMSKSPLEVSMHLNNKKKYTTDKIILYE